MSREKTFFVIAKSPPGIRLATRAAGAQSNRMPKHPQSSATAKSGTNFVRGVVEAANCIFHKIEQENDLGIDGLIELIRKESPLNKQFAVQIKAGQSYFIAKTEECLIPINGHRDYWAGYPLPVFGLVFVPTRGVAYWVNIKRYLKNHPAATVIKFKCTEVNAFDSNGFVSLFIPMVLQEIPEIPFEQALRLVNSVNVDESEVGLVVLFRKFPNRLQTWDQLVNYFKRTDAKNIPRSLMYYFAHVPWHGDIWGYGEQLTRETRDYIRTEHFQKFGLEEITKLLSLVDEENMIGRGTVGQSVEAIVSSLPNRAELLKGILAEGTRPRFVREVAALIYAMHEPQDAIKYMTELHHEGSWYMGEMVGYIRKWGDFNPYA